MSCKLLKNSIKWQRKMGNQESSPSQAQQPPIRPKLAAAGTLIPARRMSVDRLLTISTLPNSNNLWNQSYSRIIETAFTGVWSNVIPKGTLPKARIGHFTVCSQNADKAYVGYGNSPSGEVLNDVWELDLDNLTWREIDVFLKNENSDNPSIESNNGENKIKGRIGSSATMNESTIYVFGGTIGDQYITELHSIDINTGEIKFMNYSDETSDSEKPTARATPVFQYYDGRLILWGGFNGQFPTDLYSYDLQTQNWTRTDPKISGRAGIPWCLMNDQILCYGGTKGGEMLSIQPLDLTITVIPCTGILPPSENTGFQMVAADRYIFFFGGKANTSWTFLYACDASRKEKMSWFVFDMKPDGETVKTEDGHISDLGLFMLPRLHSFSAAYSQTKKALVGFFGYPQLEPPPIHMISIGEAISVLNQQDDLVKALKVTGEAHQGESKLPGIVKARTVQANEAIEQNM
ncbi:Kelch motif family protein [Tritrichomonas foetus]|uniref:Kelch motif family protein n=1 Tax=Tritrichomonas foetus TaxID=1144522 RepID=A0A1J4KS17_9EUKA|nr:Kelch motif family protein [Tritrichomonas foetus]|eukprot:OHT14071.1 Kelch motif family protein [Tritrichomonas foetus]